MKFSQIKQKLFSFINQYTEINCFTFYSQPTKSEFFDLINEEPTIEMEAAQTEKLFQNINENTENFDFSETKKLCEKYLGNYYQNAAIWNSYADSCYRLKDYITAAYSYIIADIIDNKVNEDSFLYCIESFINAGKICFADVMLEYYFSQSWLIPLQKDELELLKKRIS